MVRSDQLVVSGCAKRETNFDAGLRAQTLHIGNDAEPANLDPHGYTLMAEWTILTSLYEGLVNLANVLPAPGTGGFEPRNSKCMTWRRHSGR